MQRRLHLRSGLSRRRHVDVMDRERRVVVVSLGHDLDVMIGRRFVGMMLGGRGVRLMQSGGMVFCRAFVPGAMLRCAVLAEARVLRTVMFRGVVFRGVVFRTVVFSAVLVRRFVVRAMELRGRVLIRRRVMARVFHRRSLRGVEMLRVPVVCGPKTFCKTIFHANSLSENPGADS
jgi:hypothetical protein